MAYAEDLNGQNVGDPGSRLADSANPDENRLGRLALHLVRRRLLQELANQVPPGVRVARIGALLKIEVARTISSAGRSPGWKTIRELIDLHSCTGSTRLQ